MSGSVPAFSVSVGARVMAPVLCLPIADLLVAVQAVNEVAPSLGTCGNVRLAVLLKLRLNHRKDAVGKLLTCLIEGDNVVEL